MVDQESQSTHRHHQELHAKSVMIGVIGGLELEVHEVDSEEGGADEEDLHDGVVR